MNAPRDQLALAAVEPITDGMIVGLGTGRAASRAVRALADRIHDERLEVTCVPTSTQTEALASELAIPLVAFKDNTSIDYLFDGADEFDDRMRLLKGGGGAMTREKIAARRARRRVYLVQELKRVSRLGERSPLPVEIRESALDSARGAFLERGLACHVRAHEGGRFTTDNGNPVLDVTLDDRLDFEELARWIERLRGVVGHGLFINEADEIIVENAGGAIRRMTAET
jgi:ribose 5-phosphate isomerase A